MSIVFSFEKGMCDSPNYCGYSARWLKTVTNNYKNLIEWDKPLCPPLHEWFGSKRLWPTGSRTLCGVFEGSRFIRQSYWVSPFPLKLSWCSAISRHQLPGMLMFLLGFVCFVGCIEYWLELFSLEFTCKWFILYLQDGFQLFEDYFSFPWEILVSDSSQSGKLWGVTTSSG